jgi:Tfp pilus assembly protein PilW
MTEASGGDVMIQPGMRAAGQRGFSLVELLIAIVCTLFVSGAIFAMITAGNNAFQREPALSDMQQNARIAMDLIQRDVSMAGNGLNPLSQIFSPGLNGVGPVLNGVATDKLEVLGSAGTCPSLGAAAPVAGTTITMQVDPLPLCYASGLVSVETTTSPYSNPTFACGAAGAVLTISPAVAGGILPTAVVPAQWAHYEIVVGADGVPSLFRSTGGPLGVSPCGGVGPAQMVARGISR